MPKIEQFISLPSGRSFPSLYYGIVVKTKRNPACAEGAKYVDWSHFIPVRSHRNSGTESLPRGMSPVTVIWDRY